MQIDYQYFDPLLEKITYMSSEDIADVRRAYALAYEGHDGQTRSSGLPYITHPVAVAGILADLKLDKESIQAALLHDVIEDTKFGSADLKEHFGATVTHIVEGVTKLDKLKFRTRQEAEVANFRKMILAMTKDVRVVLIKLADRTHNMRTLGALRPDKQRRIAQETLDIYSTLAYRLGIMKIRLELDRLSLLALHPLRYKLLKEAFNSAFKNNKDRLEIIAREIDNKLISLGINGVVKVEPVPLMNIYRRMERKTQKFNSILDVFRFVIVVNSPDECYRALGVVHSLYKPVPGTFRDFVALPKINGYQSLHTDLLTNNGEPLEVFIRSHAMEEIADLGIATTLTYTPNEKNKMGQERIQHWLNSLAELQQSSVNSIEFNTNVKAEIAPDDIFVFTPRGKIIELPAGSTALDFAYYIHSNVGIHAVKATIDKREVPLETPLRNGQTVDITTNELIFPREEDLAKVRSSRARMRLKEALKDRQMEQYVAAGREILERIYQGRFEKVNPEALSKALTFFNLANVEELFVEICLGNIISPVVKSVIDSYENKASEDNILMELQKGTLYSQLSLGDLIEIGHNVEISEDAFICPHDEILITSNHGKGLLVHHASTKFIKSNRLSPYQHIRLVWGFEGNIRTIVRVVYVLNNEGRDANLQAEKIVSAINEKYHDCFRAIFRVRENANYQYIGIEMMVNNGHELAQINARIKEVMPNYHNFERIYNR